MLSSTLLAVGFCTLINFDQCSSLENIDYCVLFVGCIEVARHGDAELAMAKF